MRGLAQIFTLNAYPQLMLFSLFSGLFLFTCLFATAPLWSNSSNKHKSLGFASIDCLNCVVRSFFQDRSARMPKSDGSWENDW
jgi:hypothetical protein